MTQFFGSCIPVQIGISKAFEELNQFTSWHSTKLQLPPPFLSFLQIKKIFNMKQHFHPVFGVCSPYFLKKWIKYKWLLLVSFKSQGALCNGDDILSFLENWPNNLQAPQWTLLISYIKFIFQRMVISKWLQESWMFMFPFWSIVSTENECMEPWAIDPVWEMNKAEGWSLHIWEPYVL